MVLLSITQTSGAQNVLLSFTIPLRPQHTTQRKPLSLYLWLSWQQVLHHNKESWLYLYGQHNESRVRRLVKRDQPQHTTHQRARKSYHQSCESSIGAQTMTQPTYYVATRQNARAVKKIINHRRIDRPMGFDKPIAINDTTFNVKLERTAPLERAYITATCGNWSKKVQSSSKGVSELATAMSEHELFLWLCRNKI